ncbi:hypothetical protein LTR03_006330 [Friedmanniomyces endolithicus]|nr:hypothetical protein LTR03_006330 [Friedmanniomyces endolithicus]
MSDRVVDESTAGMASPDQRTGTAHKTIITKVPDEMLVEILNHVVKPDTKCHLFGYQAGKHHRRYLSTMANLPACERIYRLAKDAYFTQQTFVLVFESNCHACSVFRPTNHDSGYLHNDFRLAPRTSEKRADYNKLVMKLRLVIEVTHSTVPEDIEKHIGSMLLECKSLGRLEMLLTVPRCCEISEPAAKTEARMRVFEELVNIVGGYVKMMEELSGRCIRFNTVCSSRKDDEGIDWRVVSGYRAGRGA